MNSLLKGGNTTFTNSYPSNVGSMTDTCSQVRIDINGDRLWANHKHTRTGTRMTAAPIRLAYGLVVQHGQKPRHPQKRILRQLPISNTFPIDTSFWNNDFTCHKYKHIDSMILQAPVITVVEPAHCYMDKTTIGSWIKLMMRVNE